MTATMSTTSESKEFPNDTVNIMHRIKRSIEKIIIQVDSDYPAHKSVVNNLIRNKESYLHTSGWIASQNNGFPCNTNGDPIPWMNFQVISFLEERLTKNMNAFEYGSGYSTLFYARHVNHVTSLEYDRDWFKHISEMIPDNVKLLFTEKDIDGQYCRAINKFPGNFDIVVIDGRDRVNCVKQCLSQLNDSGVILLDDSSRQKYKDGIVFAKNAGFKALNFVGLKPIGDGNPHMTTILYRNNNCFDL